MPKYHIWYWPFEISDEKFNEIVRSLRHLYRGKDKTFIVVDASINTNMYLASRIRYDTRAHNTPVTIYVMGHSDVCVTSLRSEIKYTDGENIEGPQLAIRLEWLVRHVDWNATLKIKFISCRSAHAIFPEVACWALSLLSKRNFSGYAYALDITTKNRIINPNDTQTHKLGFVSTPEMDEEFTVVRAKEVRFQIWPEDQKTKEVHGTTLSDFLALLTGW
jgi:hypothetical protein